MAKPKGGARPGAGRKTIGHENDVQAAIKEALSAKPEAMSNVWKKIIEKAEAGSDKHANILFAYYYGKPRENEGQPTQMIITVNRVRR